MEKISSPNFDERMGVSSPDMLIFHYTGLPTTNDALKRMCDPEAKVSAHYMVDEEGKIIQLVNEEKRAWHAGVSSWQGVEDINSCSIGIEVHNPGHEFDYQPFTEKQIKALKELAGDIVKRHNIEARRVLGHSDVAPLRKQDPGELFPWQLLAQSGIGLWPEKLRKGVFSPDDIPSLQRALRKVGYGIDLTGIEDDQTRAVVMAFQRHWQQEKMNGKADARTVALLQAIF